MPRRLKQAAAYLLANPDEVAFEPVATIARHAMLSPSALVRLAQSIGFHGFSQLQEVFQRRLLPGGGAAAPVPPFGNDRLHGFAFAAEQSLRRLDAEISRTMLERAVELLAPAHTIFIVGQRETGHVAACLSQTMNLCGIRNVPIGRSGVSAAALDAPRTTMLRCSSIQALTTPS